MTSSPIDIAVHYDVGLERHRLARGSSQLEFVRTQEIVLRYLPGPPAIVLDVGGGPGAYALWLARLGYEVHLIDLMPLHVEQAQAASRQQTTHALASCVQGDARRLDHGDRSADAVLLLGPLYHLIDRDDRIAAWREARRVLKSGGLVFAAGISRFASLLDGLSRMALDDPIFQGLVDRDLTDGQHRNPTNHPDYFTTAYFHRPEELEREAAEAGLAHVATFAIEGPAWILSNLPSHWDDPGRRQRLLGLLQRIEQEPSMLGASAHLLTVARRADAEH